MRDTIVFWKALFIIIGLIALPWGLVADSISRVMGGLGSLVIALLIETD